jgi:tetratricopeptide (TPR) repeat protein
MPTNMVYWGNLGDARQRVPALRSRASEALQRAISLGKQQLQVNPDANTMAMLAMYECMSGDHRSSLTHIQQALAKSPTADSVLIQAVQVYELAGKRDEALEVLTKAVRLGYSIAEIQNWPPMNDLRRDPRFRQVVSQKDH